jgi:uncharacterized membrane protein
MRPIKSLLPIGRNFFAIALLGLGMEHFLFQAFVTGRAPEWPASIPGGTAWAFASGAAIIATGLAIIAGKKARVAAILAGVMILLWAVLRHIPVTATDAFLAPSWTRAGKALTFFGGTLAIAGTFPDEEGAGNSRLLKYINLSSEFIMLGRICLGLFLLITGIQHFMYTAFVASLIPGWFPGDAIIWTWIAGVALIVGGAGLLFPPTAPLAALLSGGMVFSWVWIVHVPRTLDSVSDGIAVFEALAVSGIAFVIAGYLYQHPSPRRRARG